MRILLVATLLAFAAPAMASSNCTTYTVCTYGANGGCQVVTVCN